MFSRRTQQNIRARAAISRQEMRKVPQALRIE
jgi:hypothetical protein